MRSKQSICTSKGMKIYWKARKERERAVYMQSTSKDESETDGSSLKHSSNTLESEAANA